jgi:hypothetical protein
VAAVVAQLADELGDLVRLDRVHAGRGLVEQEQSRLRRRGACDLEPAPVRVREAVAGWFQYPIRRGQASFSSAAASDSRSSASSRQAQDRLDQERPCGVRRRLRCPSAHDRGAQGLERARDPRFMIVRRADSAHRRGGCPSSGCRSRWRVDSVVLPAPFRPMAFTIALGTSGRIRCRSREPCSRSRIERPAHQTISTRGQPSDPRRAIMRPTRSLPAAGSAGPDASSAISPHTNRRPDRWRERSRTALDEMRSGPRDHADGRR